MPENRETSVSPGAQPGRPAKAKSHKAGKHGAEESDRGVVAMKQPNEEAQASEEVVERRQRTEENIVESNTPPAQNGRGVSQGLSGVRRVAREKKREKFTTLLHHVKVDLLRKSFYALKRKAAPGVDGMTWAEYEIGLEDRLNDLHSRIHRGA